MGEVSRGGRRLAVCDVDGSEYVTAAEVVRRSPAIKTVVRLYRLAAVGKVRMLQRPGRKPRYSLSDAMSIRVPD